LSRFWNAKQRLPLTLLNHLRLPSGWWDQQEFWDTATATNPVETIMHLHEIALRLHQ
jgi:hypothetical protein